MTEIQCLNFVMDLNIHSENNLLNGNIFFLLSILSKFLNVSFNDWFILESIIMKTFFLITGLLNELKLNNI